MKKPSKGDFASLHQADPGSQQSELAFRPHCKHVLSCFTVWVFNELSSPLNSKIFAKLLLKL